MKDLKHNYKMSSHINPNLKVNDTVYFHDGSSFSIKGSVESNPTHIVDEATIFGLKSVIKDIPFKVKEIGIKDVVVLYTTSVYQVDCLVEFNGIEVYTCSKMLRILQ